MGPRAGDFDEGNDAVVFPDVRLIGPQIWNVDNLFGRGGAVERDFRIVAQVDYGIAPPRIGVAFPLWTATARKIDPSSRKRMPNVASQMRVAFSSIASNTGSSSPGDLLMTCSTSEVAVCCSSDLERSLRALA